MNMLIHDLGLSRRACDRCHGQKLRCRRENNNDGCVRCVRAGVQCTPRQVRSRHRARSHAAQQASVRRSNVIPPLATPETEQTNKDALEHFGVSPSSLLDIPSDMVLAQDSSSLESDIGQPLEDRYWQSGEELGAIQTSHSGQTFSQESRSHSVERSEQEQRSELHDASHASYLLSPFTSTLLPRYSEASSKCLGRRLSFTRNITPENSRRQSQDDVRAHILSFNQQDASAFITGSDDTGTDLAYAQVVSSRRQSIASNIHGSCNTSQQTKQPVLESAKTSWIRKLSDINLELHQHMLSIPPIGARQSAWTSNDPDSIQHKKELAVDRTFKLANKYTEILNEIVSRFKSCQAYTRPTTDSLALDQPSQLLVLCSYLCLVELFDKALQHIKTWTEVRLKMGLSASDHFPIHLPGLAIGSFKLPTSSSIQPLILTCTIEATIRHMHSLVGDMMTPSSTESWKERNPTTATAEQDTSARGELSSVAKVTLQAIRAKEDSTTELIQQTWKLALRCDVP